MAAKLTGLWLAQPAAGTALTPIDYAAHITDSSLPTFASNFNY